MHGRIYIRIFCLLLNQLPVLDVGNCIPIASWWHLNNSFDGCYSTIGLNWPSSQSPLCLLTLWGRMTHIEDILPKGPYLSCVSMTGRTLLAGYHRYIHCAQESLVHSKHASFGQIGRKYHIQFSGNSFSFLSVNERKCVVIYTYTLFSLVYVYECIYIYWTKHVYWFMGTTHRYKYGWLIHIPKCQSRVVIRGPASLNEEPGLSLNAATFFLTIYGISREQDVGVNCVNVIKIHCSVGKSTNDIMEWNINSTCHLASIIFRGKWCETFNRLLCTGSGVSAHLHLRLLDTKWAAGKYTMAYLSWRRSFSPLWSRN